MYNGVHIYLRKIEKRINEIEKYIFSNVTPIKNISYFETIEYLPVSKAMKQSNFKPCALGLEWGRPWGTAWFRLRFTIPKNMTKRDVSLRFHSPMSTSAIFHKGIPLQGLDEYRDECRLLKNARGGERFELFIETAVGNHQGKYRGKSVLQRAEICAVNRDVWECFHAQKFLYLLVLELPEDSPRQKRLLHALNRSVDAFDYNNVDDKTLKHSAQAALAELEEVRSCRAEPSMPAAHLVAHSHIDVAWRWPIRETIRKCSRTFSTILHYMEEYPEFHFSQSMPQLYEYTKRRYPALYEKISRRVKEGRWEPIGGMWVEPDSNLVSGESLVRQILYGQQFFEEEFGIQCKTAWLPDMFGYSGALPQILKKCDIPYIASNKIKLNETNRFPYSTLWWRGIDGSEVLLHFFPSKAYDNRFTPAELLKATREFTESDRSNDFMFSFGYGDGGGGPTKEMFENARIAADLEGCPRLRYTSVEKFFALVEKTARNLPTWVGEIYLENHQGTYTTQGKTKKYNRQCEFLMRRTELCCALGQLSGRAYPQDELVRNWKTVLVNQFHDILPGSSIKEAYEDSEKDYLRVFGEVGSLHGDVLHYLSRNVDTRGEGEPVFVFNSLSWARTGVVEVDISFKGTMFSVTDTAGVPVPSELVTREKKKVLRFEARDVPSMGYAVFRLHRSSKGSQAPELIARTTKLGNEYLRVRFDRNGLIRSIYDKEVNRELIPKGKRANVFQMFEDKPYVFDAWNLMPDYENKGISVTALESIEVVSEGPLEASVRLVRRFSKSTVEQEISLGTRSRRIDFRTRIHWNEEHQLLKVAFPTTLHRGSPARATYEIQYGHLERPTHQNTSWDRARFEVCAHRWADLSEYGYGVSLLNDCKYGYDIRDGQLRLTLLRSPKDPDPHADIGEHLFSYALLPHSEDFREAHVIQEGYAFNEPLRGFIVEQNNGTLPSSGSFFSVDVPNVIIDCIKRAEKSDDLVIRVYEAYNASTRAVLRLPQRPLRVWECNLIERALKEYKVDGNSISFDIKPFEVKTFKVRFGKAKITVH